MPRQSLNGKRIHVMLTEPQLDELQKHSKKTGLTVSDLIRRAVDGYIYRLKKGAKR
jgi:predicted transcriptional regulator